MMTLQRSWVLRTDERIVALLYVGEKICRRPMGLDIPKGVVRCGCLQVWFENRMVGSVNIWPLVPWKWRFVEANVEYVEKVSRACYRGEDLLFVVEWR